MQIEFHDYSIQVKAKLNDETKKWLETWAQEIASQAKDNTQLDGDAGIELRKSYKAVNSGAGEAKVGTPLEAGYWEEYGTGEYAAHGDGRKGWWVYKDGYTGNGGPVLTEAAAKARAARSSSLHATNGRKPAYTLEKSFTNAAPKAKADLEARLKKL